MKIIRIYLVLVITILSLSSTFAQDGLDKYLEADRARKAKKYDIAIQLYQEAIKLEKGEKAARYFYDMGLCHRALGDIDNAIKAFEGAVGRKNDYVEALKMLAVSYEKAKKDFSTAASYYKRAAQFDTDSKTKLETLNRVITLMNVTQKFDSIPTLVEQAKKLDPSNGDIMYMEIRNLNKLGRYDSAITKAKFMLKNFAKYKARNEAGQMATIKPPRDLDRFNYEIGYSYNKKGKFDSSLVFLKQADFGKFKKRVALLLPSYQYDIAVAYFDIFNYDKAQEAVTRALQMDPKYKEPKDLEVKITTMKESVKGKQRGIKLLEDSVKINKDEKRRASVYCRLCKLQFETYNFDGAALSANECLKFFPTNLQVVLWKAIALYKVGKFNDAASDLQNVTESEDLPTDLKARFAFALGIIMKDAAKSPEGDPASQNYFAIENFKIAQKSNKYMHAARAEMEGLPGALTELQEEEMQDAGAGEVKLIEE
jgi:tetratricopeptide (TPR) repeat protein